MSAAGKLTYAREREKGTRQRERDKLRLRAMPYIKALDRYTAKAKAEPGMDGRKPFYFKAVRANGDRHISTDG